MSIVWKNNNQKRLSDIEIRKLLKNIKEIFCKRLIQYFNKKNKTVYITYFSLSLSWISIISNKRECVRVKKEIFILVDSEYVYIEIVANLIVANQCFCSNTQKILLKLK